MALLMGRSLLRSRIKQAGLNQKEFAKRLGVNESFVSRVISNDRFFSLERAVNAAEILGCDVKDLNEWHIVPLSRLGGKE